jgi:hypothetical protein
MSCDLINSALSQMGACVETTGGSRLPTHCVYPSFDAVHVFIAKVGDGFKVHDGGGAFREAWLHGRDDLLIKRLIDAECKRFRAERSDTSISVDVGSVDWVPSAILSVANASSLAAHAAVARVAATTEKAIVDEVEAVATDVFGASRVAREVEIRGKSGGKRRYDVVVRLTRDDLLLINGISPHHNSIASKFVTFSDSDVPREQKLAIHDRPLAVDDITLMQEVARVVPMVAVRAGPEKVLARAA